MKSVSQRSPYLPLTLVLFVAFIDYVGMSMTFPVFSSILVEHYGPFANLTFSERTREWIVSFLFAAGGVGAFLSTPIMGALSDQKGRRPLYLFSLIIRVFGYLFCNWMFLHENFGGLITSRFIIGIAAGNTAVVAATITDLSEGVRKAKRFGLLAMASGAGLSIGPVLGALLLSIGPAIPFLFAALLAAISFFSILFFFRETHLTPRKSHIKIHQCVIYLKQAFHKHNLRTLFITGFLYLFGWAFFLQFIPVSWIMHYNFTPETIGFLYAYGAGSYALSSGILIRPLLRFFRDETLFFYSLVFLGISLLSLLLLQPGPFWVWIYLPLLYFFLSLIYATITAMISNNATKAALGETFAIFQSVQALSFATAPVLARGFLDISADMPFLIAGILALTAALIYKVF